jgi:hypothetical protein
LRRGNPTLASRSQEVSPTPTAKVGQQVQVDVSGLQTPGVSFGGGVGITGVISRIDPRGLIEVKLSVIIEGRDTVLVPPDRVTAVQ